MKLGDMATYINGYAFKPSDWTNEGLPIIRIQDLTGSSYQLNYYKGRYPEKIRIDNGDVLISWSASLGVFIWNKGEALLNQHIFKVIFDKIEVDKQYFVYAVRYNLNHMMSKMHGATMKHIVKKDFDNIDVPCPSIKMQEEIAKKILIIDKIIDTRKRQLLELDNLIKSRFTEMFGDISREEYKYKTRKLGDVANVGSSHRVFTNEFVEHGIPFYRGTEIGELANHQTPANPYYISKEHYARLISNGTKPKIGDLLLPSICNKGQVWMVDTNAPFYYKDGRVLCVSADRGLYNTKYLQYYMKMKTEIEYPKLGSGSTFAEFKLFLLKDFDILTPPQSVQNQFSDFVEKTDKLKVTIQKSLEQTQLLFDSLMQKYFG